MIENYRDSLNHTGRDNYDLIYSLSFSKLFMGYDFCNASHEVY